jgi:hypothetical protein
LRPWYRERWPWLLAAGPCVVVVASVCSAWLAVRSDDGMVADDYYKRGLLINRTLERAPAADLSHLAATVQVADNGAVRAWVEGAPGAPSEAPASLRLSLRHPAHSTPDLVVALVRDAKGDYVGTLPEQTPGRWIVILESDAWRLPATTVAGRLTEVRLGAAPRPM